jgi:hypothetical protein
MKKNVLFNILSFTRNNTFFFFAFHVIACAWIKVGRLSQDPDPTDEDDTGFGWIARNTDTNLPEKY